MLSTDPEARSATRPTGTSLPGLIGVELRRLWWRRLTKAVLLGAVLISLGSIVMVHQSTRPETIAHSVEQYQQYLKEMEAQFAQMTPAQKQEQIDQCLKDQAQAQVDSGPVDFGCEQMFTLPKLADWGIPDTVASTVTVQGAQSLAYLLAFLAFVVAASFVCAEFSSGSMGHWLTFQPRRLRVAISKLAAVTIGGLALGTLAVLLIALGVRLVLTINRPGETLDLPPVAPPPTGEVVEDLLRVIAVVALGALVGAVLGFIIRSSTGVLAVAVAWAIGVEGIAAGTIGNGALQPWTIQRNLEAFLHKGSEYYVLICQDNGCSTSTRSITYTHGWVHLLVVLVVLVAVALATFRRRDVA